MILKWSINENRSKFHFCTWIPICSTLQLLMKTSKYDMDCIPLWKSYKINNCVSKMTMDPLIKNLFFLIPIFSKKFYVSILEPTNYTFWVGLIFLHTSFKWLSMRILSHIVIETLLYAVELLVFQSCDLDIKWYKSSCNLVIFCILLYDRKYLCFKCTI